VSAAIGGSATNTTSTPAYGLQDAPHSLTDSDVARTTPATKMRTSARAFCSRRWKGFVFVRDLSRCSTQAAKSELNGMTTKGAVTPPTSPRQVRVFDVEFNARYRIAKRTSGPRCLKTRPPNIKKDIQARVLQTRRPNSRWWKPYERLLSSHHFASIVHAGSSDNQGACPFSRHASSPASADLLRPSLPA